MGGEGKQGNKGIQKRAREKEREREREREKKKKREREIAVFLRSTLPLDVSTKSP